MIKFRDNLYIGNMFDAEDIIHKADLGLSESPITAILNLAFDVDTSPRDIKKLRYVKVSLTDDSENQSYLKKLTITILIDLLENGEVVLVHCRAGQSRSVWAALMAISEIEKKDPHDLYQELLKIYPTALYGPMFEKTYIPIGGEEKILKKENK